MYTCIGMSSEVGQGIGRWLTLGSVSLNSNPFVEHHSLNTDCYIHFELSSSVHSIQGVVSVLCVEGQ